MVTPMGNSREGGRVIVLFQGGLLFLGPSFLDRIQQGTGGGLTGDQDEKTNPALANGGVQRERSPKNLETGGAGMVKLQSP